MRRSRLRWLLPAALLAAGGVAVMVLVGADSSEPSSTTAAPTDLSPLGAAARHADVHLHGVTDANVEHLILELCTSRDGERIAAAVVDLGVTRPADVQALVEGVGRGAEEHCPAVPAEQPQLVNEAYTAALSLLRDAG